MAVVYGRCPEGDGDEESNYLFGRLAIDLAKCLPKVDSQTATPLDTELSSHHDAMHWN